MSFSELREKEVINICDGKRYGHPIDSGLVRALDTELLNGAFRKFVDFNADRSMGQIVATSTAIAASRKTARLFLSFAIMSCPSREKDFKTDLSG